MLNLKYLSLPTAKSYISCTYMSNVRWATLQSSCSPCGDTGIQAVSIQWLHHLNTWPPQLLQQGARELGSHTLTINALAQEGTYPFCSQPLSQNQSHGPRFTARQGRKYCHPSGLGRKKRNGFQYPVPQVYATRIHKKQVTGRESEDLTSQKTNYSLQSLCCSDF